MRNLFTIILVTLLICSCDFSSDSVNDANDVLSTEESIKEMASEYGLQVTINEAELQKAGHVDLDSIEKLFQSLASIKQIEKFKVSQSDNRFNAKGITPIHPVCASGHTEMHDFQGTDVYYSPYDGYHGHASFMWYYDDDHHQVYDIRGEASIESTSHSIGLQHCEFTTLQQLNNSNAITFKGFVELDSRKYLNVRFYFYGNCSQKDGEIHWS